MPEATDSKNLVITRIFEAPVEKVWAAWTDPEKLMKWWGPKHFTSPVAKTDLRVGGKYLWGMQTPDGRKTYTAGIFKEIVPNQRIVYTDSFADEHGNPVDPAEFGITADLPKELVVTVTFEPLPSPPGGGALTRLTVKHVSVPGDHGEFMEAGWHQMLDKLVKYVEGGE